MATQDDVRRIALSLPGVIEAEERFAFSVLNGSKKKGFAWVWLERVDPKKGRIPCPGVIGLRVENGLQKEMILASDTRKFFTEPHYNGYPSILVRLAEVGIEELTELVTDAWACMAPLSLLKSHPEYGRNE